MVAVKKCCSSVLLVHFDFVLGGSARMSELNATQQLFGHTDSSVVVLVVQ